MSLEVPTGYGLASIILEGPDGTQPYVTTIGVGLALELSPVQVANHVLWSYYDAFSDLTNDALRIDRVSLYVGDSTGPSGSVDSTQDGGPGLRSGEMAPTAMSLILRKQTEGLGRQGRGRMFIPGVLADGDVTAAGRIEEASVDIFVAACANFYLNLLGLGDEPEVVAPYLLHSEGSGVAPTLIESFGISPLVGWIRGRIR